MAYTQADLDKLQKALSSGVRSVTFSDGRSVVYRTMEELKDAIATITTAINDAAGTPRIRRRRYTSDKGL